jgi:thiamine monophosphate kinase
MVGPAPPAHAAGYAFPPAAWPGQLISTATVICENYHFQVIIGGDTVTAARTTSRGIRRHKASNYG